MKSPNRMLALGALLIASFALTACDDEAPTEGATTEGATTETTAPSPSEPAAPEGIVHEGITDVTCLRSPILYTPNMGDIRDFRCPSGCRFPTVWGTDVYTADSTICNAAIHAGVLTSEGGVARIQITEVADEYVGSNRNGIESSSQATSSSSFIFLPIEATPEEPTQE